MKINYLEPLWGISTKRFIHTADGWELLEGYSAGKKFNGYVFDAKNLDEVYEIIKKNHNLNRFMIQGEFLPGISLKKIYRRIREESGHVTIRNRDLEMICFDIDNYPVPASIPPTTAVEIFVSSELPSEFAEADYIFQFSASFGLFPPDNDEYQLKCHLFFWLEKAVSNLTVREWIIQYNQEKKWGNILDPSIFVATQPIYTQRRICLEAPDPFPEALGIVKKNGPASWLPPVSILNTQKKLVGNSSQNSYSTSFSLDDSIKKILAGEAFHTELRSAALSFCAQGMPATQVKKLLQGIMQAAKTGLSPQRRHDWEVRYKDIGRLVESCFKIIKNPALEDLAAWIAQAPAALIIQELPGKCEKKSAAEIDDLFKLLAEREDIDIDTLRKKILNVQEKEKKQTAREKRIQLKKDRESRKIFEVIVNKHNYTKAADECAQILTASERLPPVFKNEFGLVWVDERNAVSIREKSRRFLDKKKNKGIILRQYKKPFHTLIARLGKDIRFIPHELGEELKCPEILASELGAARSKNLREITGLVECPFVQADFSIFDREGYDEKTGLYSRMNNIAEKKIVSGEVAFEYICNEVLDEFPFSAPLDRALMVAAMLALMQRPLLAQDPAGIPGFGIVAPVQSSGKTTLVNVATNAIYQHSVPASTFSTDEEELTKHLLAVLIEGHTCVLFDNIKQGTEITSDVLARAMSSEIFGGRLLGVNRTASVQASVIWFFTGNNISFTGDFATRVFPINLNPMMEHPDQRDFKRENILDWVLKRRPHIINALISIILSAKDSRAALSGTASRFNLWDKYIRDPIFLASGIDINQSIMLNKENDQDFILKKRLVSNLQAVFGKQPATSREIINTAFSQNEPRLSEPLEEILGAKFCDNPKSVGRLLGKMVGRAYGEITIIKEETDRAYWSIVPIKSLKN